ncbi:MAG: type II toxin-antitoxin system HicB family antitoxin [Ferruginibacter sp.]
MPNQYIIIIEQALNNFSAFCPDVPGCASTGKTVEETATNMKEALEFHLDGEKYDHKISTLQELLNAGQLDVIANEYYLTTIAIN